MKILAFDTCLDKMYIALGDADSNSDVNILGSKIVETTKDHYHSAFLISTIRDILIENSLTPKDIDVIAVNVGPGSFTGIRACTTVARVFAQGENLKTVGVSSLEILSRLNNSDKKALVALDARKEMAYVAIFDETDQILQPQTILLDELKNMIAKEDYFIITDRQLSLALNGVSYQESNNDLGKILIQIAAEKLKTDFDTNWRKLLPLYIQPPAITVKK